MSKICSSCAGALRAVYTSKQLTEFQLTSNTSKNVQSCDYCPSGLSPAIRRLVAQIQTPTATGSSMLSSPKNVLLPSRTVQSSGEAEMLTSETHPIPFIPERPVQSRSTLSATALSYPDFNFRETEIDASEGSAKSQAAAINRLLDALPVGPVHDPELLREYKSLISEPVIDCNYLVSVLVITVDGVILKVPFDWYSRSGTQQYVVLRKSTPLVGKIARHGYRVCGVPIYGQPDVILLTEKIPGDAALERELELSVQDQDNASSAPIVDKPQQSTGILFNDKLCSSLSRWCEVLTTMDTVMLPEATMLRRMLSNELKNIIPPEMYDNGFLLDATPGNDDIGQLG